jgi:hypothetical protein
MLAIVRQESQLLQDSIRDERESSRSKVEEAKAVEEALNKKIQSLSAQLSHFKGQSMDSYKSMELRLRRQVQKECSQRDSDIRSLQQALQDARSTLEAMKKERSATLRSIQLALGKTVDGVCCLAFMLAHGVHSWYSHDISVCCTCQVDNLSAMERMATVGSIARNLSSSQAATNALSKALTESEIDRKLASEVSECTLLVERYFHHVFLTFGFIFSRRGMRLKSVLTSRMHYVVVWSEKTSY